MPLGPLAAAAGAALLGSCLLSGYEYAEAGAGGSGGSTTASSTSTASTTGSGGGGTGGGELPLCETTRPPGGPDNATRGGSFDKWLALRAIRLGDPTDPESIPGFDLDRAYSCRQDCASIDPECTRPDFLAGLDAEQEARRCDWENGVDNTGVHLFDLLAAVSDTNSVDLSEQADAGEWSLLVRVSGWNGEPNDTQVTVSLYSTLGFEMGEGGSGGGTAATTGTGAGGSGEPAPMPIWNGTDRWIIDSRGLNDSASLDSATFKHEQAYVSEGLLVAQIDGLFYAGSARVPIKVASGLLVARLETDGPLTKLTGATFAGRWAANDLIAAFGPLLVSNFPLCSIGSLFVGPMTDMCRLVDVTSPAASGTCNAISIAIGFDAEEALPGAIVTPTTEVDDCVIRTCETLLGPFP